MTKQDALDIIRSAVGPREVMYKMNTMLDNAIGRVADAQDVEYDLDDGEVLINWLAEQLVDE